MVMVNSKKKQQFAVSRREMLLAFSLPLLGSSPAWGQAPKRTAQSPMNEAQRQMLTTLPVFPWLVLQQSTTSSIQSNVQALVNSVQGITHTWGGSEITGGETLNINKVLGEGLLGEKDLRILSISFSPSRKLELVTFMVDRGWKNANVQPLIDRISARYAMYASPVKIMDGQSEATDQYFVFDIGRFVIEIAVPQHGTFIPVYFTTKEIHRKMRITDNTYDLFKEHLEKVGKQ